MKRGAKVEPNLSHVRNNTIDLPSDSLDNDQLDIGANVGQLSGLPPSFGWACSPSTPSSSSPPPCTPCGICHNTSRAGEAYENRHQPLSLARGQSSKRHGEGVAVFPEILAGNVRAVPDIRPAAIRQTRLGKRQEARMPQPQEDPRCQQRLPSRLRRNDGVHQGE